MIAWGRNANGQTDVPAGLSDVEAIAAGEVHSLALKKDGTVVAWGTNSYGQATVPPGLTDVVAISAGPYHSAAVRADGTVVTWPTNSPFLVTAVPPGLAGVSFVAAGGDVSDPRATTLALQTDGHVIAWGYDPAGAATVPNWLSNAVAVAAGPRQSLAIRAETCINSIDLNGPAPVLHFHTFSGRQSTCSNHHPIWELVHGPRSPAPR